MNYPSDFTETLRKKPICGVLAIAIVANVTFAKATEAVKNNLMPWQKRHGGKTYDEQRTAALRELGVLFKEIPCSKMTLQRWVAEYAQPGKTYKVTTSGHAVVVRDQMVADQVECKHYADHGARRCFIRQVLEIL